MKQTAWMFVVYPQKDGGYEKKIVPKKEFKLAGTIFSRELEKCTVDAYMKAEAAFERAIACAEDVKERSMATKLATMLLFLLFRTSEMISKLERKAMGKKS